MDFIQYRRNPIFPTNHTFACFLKVGDTYHSYYYIQSTHQIYHKTSPDGMAWTDDTANNPITIDGRGTTVVSVWTEGSTWYMLFNRTDGIGLATSSDGITWTSEATNPVLPKGAGAEWDNDQYLEPWGLIKVDSTYYLYYNTLGAGSRSTGIATSTDLLTWTKNPSNPIWTGGRFCVFVFKYTDGYYYALVPHYRLGTGGAPLDIELYRSSLPTFASKEFMGFAMPCGEPGTWNGLSQDTCWIVSDVDRLVGGDFYMYFSGCSNSYASPVWNEGVAFYTNIGTAGEKEIRGLSHG